MFTSFTVIPCAPQIYFFSQSHPSLRKNTPIQLEFQRNGSVLNTPMLADPSYVEEAGLKRHFKALSLCRKIPTADGLPSKIGSAAEHICKRLLKRLGVHLAVLGRLALTIRISMRKLSSSFNGLLIGDVLLVPLCLHKHFWFS